MSYRELSDPFVASAIEANRQLYVRLKTVDDTFYRPHQVGAGGDVTHGIDQIAEDIFVDQLHAFGQIYSEESGLIGSGERMIYLDPLDGSDNFLSHFPYYGTSVAIESENGVEAGIVANLATGKLFVKKGSLFLKGDLETGMFAPVIANPHPKIGIFERAYRSYENADRLKRAKIKYRVPGAVALSLAMAKYVDFVLFEGDMRAFDVKAGLYMCEGLYQHKTNDLTIICHHEKSFKRLLQLFSEDER